MSKGNMLLGLARGKVGSLVFSRAAGKQIVRSRAEVVKNPRTESQMIQRIMLNTVAQAYSTMKVIVDHSYQGVAEGQQSMSMFMQRNLNLIRQHVAEQKAAGKSFDEIKEFSALKSNNFALNAYEIAKGKLPVINPNLTQGKTSASIVLDENTYEGFINQFGLQRGDQITFVAVIRDSKGKRAFTYARVILDPRDANGNELPLSTKFVEDGKVVSPSDRNEGTFSTLAYGNSELQYGFGGLQIPIIGTAVIVSRRANDGTWQRSNAKLVISETAQINTWSLQACLNRLADSSLATLSEMYLNNAGTGNVSGKTTGGNTGGGGNASGPSGEG